MNTIIRLFRFNESTVGTEALIFSSLLADKQSGYLWDEKNFGIANRINCNNMLSTKTKGPETESGERGHFVPKMFYGISPELKSDISS